MDAIIRHLEGLVAHSDAGRTHARISLADAEKAMHVKDGLDVIGGWPERVALADAKMFLGVVEEHRHVLDRELVVAHLTSWGYTPPAELLAEREDA